MFRNDKRKIYMVICDTKIAANQDVVAIAEEIEYTKGVIRTRISKTNRQHNGQKNKYKRTNNDLQNIHIKLKIG